MTVHLQKLSVGSESIQTLADWQDHVVARRQQQGLSAHHVHVTRMFPKRKEDLLEGGSIYWVIKGNILCRNRIVALDETTKNGHRACAILMDPELIPVLPVPRRAFQGWRYLQVGDAPADLTGAENGADLPAAFRAKLIQLGAW
ncbi:DUF1489 family protein [Litorimonas sp. WD9-15]|uniref:DUF1489 family protein n=1 Tax=Litorimonas sp. WD9-15 TaxID=3418716 RepID=UPI003CFD416E